MVLPQLFALEEALQLLPAPDELIWGSLMFGLLFALLSKLAFPKLKQGLADRSSKIAGQIEGAERTKQEADQVLADYQAKIANAKADAAKIIDEGRKTGEALKAEIIEKANVEASVIVERARGEVAGERERAVAELRTSVGEISLNIASRVIGKELSSGDAHKSLVDDAIKQIAATNGNN